MNQLKIENVSKIYGKKKALNGVSVEFNEGITVLPMRIR